MKSFLTSLAFTLFIGLILFLCVKGSPGNPKEDELMSDYWRVEGPFSSSNERARFALTYSLIENKTPFFSIPLARASTPDLGFINGKYVSLFAPGVSLFLIPGFYLGKIFNSSQLGAFLTITLFAILNSLLIGKISRLLGASKLSSKIASLLFIFATPAFAYSTTTFQHHISLYLLLLSLLMIISYPGKIISLIFTSSLFGLSLIFDYPNFFLFLPMIIYQIFSMIKVFENENSYKIRFSIIKPILFVVSALVFLAPLLIYNNYVHGSYFKLSGTAQDVAQIKDDGSPVLPQDLQKDVIRQNPEQKTALAFFNTRNLINGLYIHLFSPDRGVIFYAPVVLFGILGIYLSYRGPTLKDPKGSDPFLNPSVVSSQSSAVNSQSPSPSPHTACCFLPATYSLLISIPILNLILYSLWGDPWGGWSFGSRYLIPAYGMLAILSGFFFDNLPKKLLYKILIILLIIYSVSVNTLGATTSVANPPKIHVLELEKLTNKVEKYTYRRNIDLLSQNKSSAYFFKTLGYDLTNSWGYYFLINISILTVILSLVIKAVKKDYHHD